MHNIFGRKDGENEPINKFNRGEICDLTSGSWSKIRIYCAEFPVFFSSKS